MNRPPLGVIVTTLEIIQSGFYIVVISTIAEWIVRIDDVFSACPQGHPPAGQKPAGGHSNHLNVTKSAYIYKWFCQLILSMYFLDKIHTQDIVNPSI